MECHIAYRSGMKLHEQASRPLHQVTAYSSGSVSVGEQVLRAPFMLAPGQLIEDWVNDLDALDAAALEPLWPLAPRIVLLGAPATAPARWSALRRLCSERGAALEVMDVGAACRTFNVLAQEDRAVVALLFP